MRKRGCLEPRLPKHRFMDPKSIKTILERGITKEGRRRGITLTKALKSQAKKDARRTHHRYYTLELRQNTTL